MPLFQLHEGAIVSVTGEDGGWVRVPLVPDQSGWTPEDTVGLIKKPAPEHLWRRTKIDVQMPGQDALKKL